MLKDLVHGIGVKEPPIDGFCGNFGRDIALLVPLNSVPLIFFVLREVVVFNPVPLKLERH